ncbi:hypothetical protein [Nevskia ramosa]|uniref:hypothetical protein n=1 Tax=Nevskia ramosa TaxID=64002 RepID=UPI003D0BE307
MNYNLGAWGWLWVLIVMPLAFGLIYVGNGLSGALFGASLTIGNLKLAYIGLVACTSALLLLRATDSNPMHMRAGIVGYSLGMYWIMNLWLSVLHVV